MLVTRNAVGGISPCASAAPPMFAFGLKPIGQNGLRAAASTWKDDLFFSVMTLASADGFKLGSAGAGVSRVFGFGAPGAAFCSAANNGTARAIDKQIGKSTVFIVFRSPS